MALRLRRGTDTERQLITPLEGELIYTTDLKEMWVGDGSTLGGLRVSGVIPSSIDDLDDVEILVTPTVGQVLKWDGANFVPSNDTDIIDGSNYRINIVGDDSTIMVNTSTGSFVGDLTGSVFSDDSTTIVDGVTGQVVGDITNINTITENLIVSKSGNDVKLAQFISETTGGANDIEFMSYRGTQDAKVNVQVGDGTIDLISKSWHSDDYRSHSLIRFRTDPAGLFNNPTTGLPGSLLFSVFDDNGTQQLQGTMELKQDGLLVGVSLNPNNDRLRVGGNASFDGAIIPGVYADPIARDTAIPTPVAGMVVFLTDGTGVGGTAKFQGNTDGTTGGWVDLN